MKIAFGVVLHCVLFLNICKTFGEKETNAAEVKNGLDVKDTIEKFLKELQSKIPEVLTLTDRNFTIPSNKYVTGTVNFSSISCKGLKEFNATVIYRNFVPLPKAYTLSLEDIVLNFDYKSDLTMYNSKYLALFGEGTASISLTNLIFDGNVSISILPINASMTADVDLGNVLVDITGLLDDENFSTDFGKFLGKSITTIFDTNKSVISEKLTKILNFILQEILAHHQITDGKEYDLLDDLLHFFQTFFFTTSLLTEK